MSTNQFLLPHQSQTQVCRLLPHDVFFLPIATLLCTTWHTNEVFWYKHSNKCSCTYETVRHVSHWNQESQWYLHLLLLESHLWTQNLAFCFLCFFPLHISALVNAPHLILWLVRQPWLLSAHHIPLFSLAWIMNKAIYTLWLYIKKKNKQPPPSR